MDRETQAAQSEILLEYLNGATTAMTADVYRQPVDQYTTPEAFAEEQTLFRREPLLLCLGTEMPAPGDYVSDDFSGVPVLAVRQGDGSLRAMINVCRHRGARLATGRGNAGRGLSCPYHAWRYGLDGRLLAVPFERGFEGSGCNGLPALPVVERYGAVWVIPDPDASPSDSTTAPDFGSLDPLARDLTAYRLGDHHHFETRTVEIRMNWKLVVDTFLESYHIQVLHRKTIAPYLHGNLGTFDALGRHLRMIIPRHSLADLANVPPPDRDLVRHSATVYVLFPNTVFISQGDHLEVFRVYPGDAPDHARMHVSLYAPEPIESDSARRHWRNNLDLLLATVLEEDFPLGENIQKDFGVGGQSHITFGRNEPALAHFHRMIDERLGRSRASC
ncbi:MAG: SRPBCC family protein [Pseudomonadales bacterium]|jgi:phenylpropionate dioxygenase-like ring-hydroxylating dioxygenase large terminal subunit